MKEHYTTLNVAEGASLAEIKKASRKLLLKYHPDLHPQNQAWAEEKTKTILYAYNVLCDTVNDKGSVSFRVTKDIKREKPGVISNIPLMVFGLGDLLFAVTVTNVRQIVALHSLKVVKITNRKGLYPFITGVIHFQGSIAPLLDLGNKLSLEKMSEKQQVLVCDIENQPLALLIDEGKKVISINPQEFLDRQYMKESDIPELYVTNVIKTSGQRIHVLDLAKLLTN